MIDSAARMPVPLPLLFRGAVRAQRPQWDGMQSGATRGRRSDEERKRRGGGRPRMQLR